MRLGKRLVIYLILMLLGLWFQSSVCAVFFQSYFGAIPQVIVILLVYLAFDFREVSDFGLAFFIGLSLDFLSGTLLGPWAAAAVAVYAICALLSRSVYADNKLLVALLCFCVVIVAVIVNQLLVAHAPQMQISSWNVLMSTTLKEALLTAVLSPIFFMFFAWAFNADFKDSRNLNKRWLKNLTYSSHQK